MKKINVRFVVGLVGTLVLAGAVGYGVHAYQKSRYAGFFLERAEQAEHTGEIAAALRELGHYLTLVPDDASARAHMGVLLAETRQDYAAFTVLEKALRQADDEPARRALVEVLLRMQRWSDARNHLEEHLLPAAPNDPVLLDRLAQCQWATDEHAEATASLEKAIERDPHQIESFLRLMAVLDAHPELVQPDPQGNAKDAEYWRSRMVEANPEAIAVYLNRASVQQSRAMAAMRGKAPSPPDYEAVRKSCETALKDAHAAQALARQAGEQLAAVRHAAEKNAPLENARQPLSTVRQYLASIMQAEQLIDGVQQALDATQGWQAVSERLTTLERITQAFEAEILWLAASSTWALARAQEGKPDADHLEQARKLAQEGLALKPQDDRLYSTLADIELTAEDREAAKAWLRQGVETVKTRSNLPVNLARMQLEDGQIAEARRTVDILLEKQFPAPLVNYLAARVEYADGQWHKVVKLLADASTQAADAPDLVKEMEYWLGRSYQNLQKTDLEMQAYRRALVIDPLYTPARLMLADALRRQGQWDLAMEQYRAGPAATPENVLLAVQVQLQKNLSLPPAQRNWRSLESSLNELTAKTPDNPDVILLRTEMLVAQGQTKEAMTLLETARESIPNSVAIRCALAQLVMQEADVPDFAKAARLLDEAQEQLGDCVAIRLTRGALAVRRDGNQAGNELRQLAGNTQPFSANECLHLWRRLAQLATACGDLEQAAQLTRQVAEREPHDLNIWLQLLAIVLGQNDFAAGDEVLAKLEQLEAEPRGPIWSYCKAAVLAAQAEETNNRALRGQALEHINRALGSRPNWQRALLLAAMLAQQLGDTEVAIAHYLKLIELGESSTELMRETIRLLTDKSRYKEADTLLTRLEQQPGANAPDLIRFRARISGSLQDFAAALPAARTVAAASEDYQDHLWLARLCGLFAALKREAGVPDEAATLITEGEQALQKADHLAPDVPDTWAVRLQFLLRLDRQEDIEKILADASGRFADKPGVVASLLLAAGQEDRAAEQFRSDLKRWPEDIQLIRRVANFCLETGRPQLATDQLRAIATGRIEVKPEELIWSRRVLAVALRSEGKDAQLDEALALVEQNLQASPSSVLDLRAKAVVLTSSSDPARRHEARQILESLINSDATGVADTRRLLAQLYLADGDWTAALPHLRLATDFASLARYVQVMLSRSRLDEAELGVVRLEEIAPDQPATIILRAQLLFRRGDYDRAERRVDALVSLGNDQAVSPGNVLAAAAVLEDFAGQLKGSQSHAAATGLLGKAESYLRGNADRGIREKMALAAFCARNDKSEESLRILEENLATVDVEALAQGVGAFAGAAKVDEPTLTRLNAILASAFEKHDRPLPLLDAQARVLIAAQQFDEAVTLYREILTKDPSNLAIKNNLAELLGLLGQSLDEALKLAEETIEVMGAQPVLLDTRATIYVARGQHALAVNDMHRVLAEDPKPNRYFHLARALQAAGRSAEAHDALLQALTRGLQVEDLHPLERDAHRRLVAAEKSLLGR
ncbi:MAG: tetratricopeptide repeat protein [Pirellulaceae bacterium]